MLALKDDERYGIETRTILTEKSGNPAVPGARGKSGKQRDPAWAGLAPGRRARAVAAPPPPSWRRNAPRLKGCAFNFSASLPVRRISNHVKPMIEVLFNYWARDRNRVAVRASQQHAIQI